MLKSIVILIVVTFLALALGRAQENLGGTLVIVGGGLQLDNQKVYQAFIESGGGKDSIRIAVIPAASAAPVQSGASCVQDFGHYGVPADRIKIFPVAVKDDESTKEVDESTWSKNGYDKKLAEEILGYSAVFFVGGDQARYLETLKDKDGNDTPLLASIRKIYTGGGVLGGSSAGAAIMSDPMICGGNSIDAQVSGAIYQAGACPPETMPGVLLTRGLGFLEAGLVDQHHIKRGRCGRLIAALLYRKDLFRGIGIGIDEDTAAVYRAKTKTVEVIGRSGVLIVDTREAVSEKFQPGAVFGDIILHYLEEGDIYQTETGTITIDPRRKKIEPGKEEYETSPLDTNIFGKDAIKEVIIAGLVDNRQKEAVGLGFRLEPAGKETARGKGKGVKLVFRKSEQTVGYYAEIEGRDTYTALNVRLDIYPVFVEIRSESPGQRPTNRINKNW